MGRQSVLLQHIDKNCLGLEIGPCHSPVAPKKSGYRVHVMDHLSEIGLRNKYKDSGVNLDQIEPVDFIWQGQAFSELIGGCEIYDWIVASHVIEHTPDLIGFLKNCSDILSKTGKLSLAIPDKRYCFDHFRPLSGLGQIVDAHLKSPRFHSTGAVVEHMMYATSRSGQLGWNSSTKGLLEFSHSLPEIKQLIQNKQCQSEYIDVHAWCFVPHSFRLLIHDLHDLGLIELRELSFHNTIGHEFFMTLGRSAGGKSPTRMELLENMEREISGLCTPPATVKGYMQNIYWRFRELLRRPVS